MKLTKKNVIGPIIVFILVLLIGSVVWNHIIRRDFQNLGDTEQQILKEYNEYYKVASKEKQFDDFSLTEQTILVMNGRMGNGYLINPTQTKSTVFSHSIKMPEEYEIRVSRVCWFSPQLLKLRFLPGNFNTNDANHHVLGNQVYFLRYDEQTSIQDKLSNMHFIRLLTHESLHYYVQQNWKLADRCTGDMIRDEDLPLLKKKYTLLGEMQTELQKDDPDKARLKSLAKSYLENETARKDMNPEFWKAEQEMETEEGTATYVSDKACQITGYDYPVYSFDKLMPLYEAGTVTKDHLASSIPYDSGALLCHLYDELGIKDWQKALKQQTKDNPKVLYDILNEYVKKNS